MTKHFCNDYGDNPACERIADERLTMDFTDVEPGLYLYWCVKCGKVAHLHKVAIEDALETRPGFAQELAVAIADAEHDQVKQ